MKARTLTLFVVAAFLATTLATRSVAARAIPKLSAKERAAKIAALPADELARRGRRSRERYAARFDTKTCVTRVGEFFLELDGRSRVRTGGAA